MKKFLCIAALSATVATGSPAQVNASTMVGLEVRGIPEAVTVPAIAVIAVLFAGDAICRSDKDHSCTEEAKKAGQNLIDYARGKKNGFKAIARLGQRVFGW